MTNQYQPTGVSATIDVSQVPDSGFIALEIKEGNQVILPSHIVITGDGSDLKFVMNDALLKTPDDAIVIDFGRTSGTVYVPNKPIHDASELVADNIKAKFDATPSPMLLRAIDGVIYHSPYYAAERLS